MLERKLDEDFNNVRQRLHVITDESAPQIIRKRGRPAGRRSDAAYVQTSIYIRRDVHSGVMLSLAEAKYKGIGTETDFSELTDRLLSEWLAEQRLRAVS